MSSTDKTGLYSIARLSEAKIADLAKLYFAVYSRQQSSGYFQLKYNTAYTGVEFVGYIAYQQEIPVAFYGVIPCFISHNNEILLTAQSADTMTHPAHRNKGLFVELANRTFELCKTIGIGFVFGFPNQNSLPGFINKLNWQITEHMACFVIPVKGLPLEKISLKFPSLKKAYAVYCTRMLKRYILPRQGISSSVLCDGYGGLQRDEGYLQNKSYYARLVIHIDASKIWIRINNGILIGDIAVTEDSFLKVINKLKLIAAKMGLNQIQFHTCTNTTLYRLFAAHYLPIESFPVIFKDLGAGVDFEKIKFTLADIDIF